MILPRKGWMMVIYTPYGAFVTFQTTKQIFYTAHVRNPPHDMEWTLLSHRPPLKLVPPFLLMILMWSASGVFGFLHRSEKNRRLKLRELSPALIAAFSNMVIFHPVGRSFSGGCMCVRNDSTPPKKTGVNVVPEFWWIQISIAIQIKLLYLGELQVQFCSSLDNTPPPKKKMSPKKEPL